MTRQPIEKRFRRLAELLLGSVDLAELLPPGALPAGRGEPGCRRLGRAAVGRLAGACGALGLAVAEDADGVPWVETELDCGHPGGSLLMIHFAGLIRTLGFFDAELAVRVHGPTARVRATAEGDPGLTDGCFLVALVCRQAARRLAAAGAVAGSTAGGRLDPTGAAAPGPPPPALDDLPPPAGWREVPDPDTGGGELVGAWKMRDGIGALTLAGNLQAITAAGRLGLPLAYEVDGRLLTVGLQWRDPEGRSLALLTAGVADLLAPAFGGRPIRELARWATRRTGAVH